MSLIAARYAFTPNSLGYCGTGSFSSAFRKGDPEGIAGELRRFHPHFAYLRLIARENSRDPFDDEVVRAFWIGNSLLESIPGRSLQRFIREELFPRGHPRAGRLAQELPEGLVPHHSFNSLYINFVTDKVEKSISNFDSCCVLPATVLSVSGSSMIVDRHCIEAGPSLGKREERILLESDGIRFIDTVGEGDIVSVHWGMAIEKLTQEQADSILRYTRQNAEALRQRSIAPSA